MITRYLLKQEIDSVLDEHLVALYNIIKIFKLPAGMVISDSYCSIDAACDWETFIEETYGCLKDSPIERPCQGDYELREAIE